MRGSALVLLSPCVRKKLPVAGYMYYYEAPVDILEFP